MEQNSNLKDELAQIDKRIEEYQAQVDLGTKLEGLHKYQDFIDVIMVAYFEDEAKRICDVLVEPSNLSREKLENLGDKLIAIRNFKKFFKTILINASVAPMQIEEEEAHRAQLTASNANDSDTEE